ncbi:MAG: hypothetical protein ACAH80_05650 [Alphaproteobacteria bacterium]
MKTIKEQYDEAAKKLASTLERRDADKQLAKLQAAVQAFRDEGFAMSMEVRPDKIGNTVFSEDYGQKIMFNGEVQAEGQRVAFAILKTSDAYADMYFRMSWGEETRLHAAFTFSSQQSPPGWIPKSVYIAGVPDETDEYGDDPAPLPAVKPLEVAFREVLVNVLAKATAAAQYNISPDEGTSKSFKVPAQIKLSKGSAP